MSYRIYVVIATCLMLQSATAQESENPPTLKLDRIPSSPAFAGQTRAPGADASDYKVEVLATGLSTPWAIAFLPDNEILITENSTGAFRILRRDGTLSTPLAGMPAVSHEGWSGLFDVVLDPDFANNHQLYFSYTAPPVEDASAVTPRVARATLNRDALRLDNVEVIRDNDTWQELHFTPDGKLLVPGKAPEGDAQDLTSFSGKLLRVNPNGSAPRDNPWSSNEEIPTEIFSYGHRDISGFATHPVTGAIWITEHGPRGGDELNIIRAGANYGWPVISYGTQYTGEPVGHGDTRQEGMDQPRYFWRPSIAPSGLMFYTGDMFPEWHGDVFVTALTGQHIARLEMDGDRVIAEERLLIDREQRIRELKQGPDGALYALTTEESDAPKGTSQLLRISK